MPIGNSIGRAPLRVPATLPQGAPRGGGPAPATYSNLDVGPGRMPTDVADPAVMRGPDGIFYAYATQTDAPNAHNLPIYASRDLVHWQYAGDAMPAKPQWAQGDMWAPQTARTGDHYTMFYSARDHNGMMNIGYAVSPTPVGPFTDKGIAIPAPQYGPDNNPGVTIDPNFFQDPSTGRMYLYWGSANGDKRWFAEGISAQEIRFRPDGTMEQVGEQRVVKPKLPDDRGIVEGAWVEKHGNDYYMFYSDGDFAGRDGKPYQLNVARSNSPLGPFIDHRPVMGGSGPFVNPGHNSTIKDDAGQEWSVGHAYQHDASGDRQMILDKIEWGPDGWPTINHGQGPSADRRAAPVIAGGSWGAR
jgi:arabinan endo-1,5-alpha-L-arabinosidase